MELLRAAGLEEAVRAAVAALPASGGTISGETLASAEAPADTPGVPAPAAPPSAPDGLSPTSGDRCAQDLLDWMERHGESLSTLDLAAGGFALLARPDGIVAYRAPRLPEDPARAWAQVMARQLGRA
jgi:hypothetical protein